MAAKVIKASGIDIGSRKTRCAACIVENGRIELKGYAQIDSIGWANGTIADQSAVTECAHWVLREVERVSGLQLNDVVVGVGGPTVRGHNARGHLHLGRPREITQRDVNKVVTNAVRVQLPEDRMVLQLCQQDFMVDDHPGHRDPRNMIGTELELNVHLVTASIQEHATLITAVHQAHMAVEETVFEAMAACQAAVLPQERRDGIAVVDIGAQSTEMVVYYGDALQLAATLRVGGDHFTKDVVHGLHIGFEDAEMVKEEYGSAISSATSESSTVEVPPHDGRDGREISRSMLNKILESRAVDMFKFIYREIARVGMESALVGGIVLTGGGSKLPDLCQVADDVLKCQARKGLPVGIRNWPSEIYDPEWTTVAGLAMYAGRLKMQGEVAQQSVGFLGKMLK
jgi:cell division protein FtsA